MNQAPLKRYLSVNEAAYILNLRPGTIRKKMSLGELPYIKVFRRSVIDPDVVEALIESGRREAFAK